jgi:hypothetical protein
MRGGKTWGSGGLPATGKAGTRRGLPAFGTNQGHKGRRRLEHQGRQRRRVSLGRRRVARIEAELT